MTDRLWQTKLLARVHDPAEKALVLMRDPAGHEGGTTQVLRDLLFQGESDTEMERWVKRADWWAAAADRPQWPKDIWAQVRWEKSPILVHPLSGREFDLSTLATTDYTQFKERSESHFKQLIVYDGNAVDWKKTLFAFWRFGAEVQDPEDDSKLGALWSLLPADTRVPDHSIWDHLDLTSAFAGAFAADNKQDVALLIVSLGPVQSFIASARTTSDLWAGSHLLAHLSWEAMKPLCEQLGPDTILFPRLRGLPLVDSWLRDDLGLDCSLFEECDWVNQGTDANPLFAAALPNRFVAIVPACQVEALAQESTDRTRNWLQGLGKTTVSQLLQKAGFADDPSAYCYQQMREQIGGFPEVHWASVPFSLVRPKDKSKRDLNTKTLEEAVQPFFPETTEMPGFLGSPAWTVLQRESEFFSPNPGVLYPAVHDLAERTLASAKAVKPFKQMEQNGWRCSMTGETEWLTTNPQQLTLSYRQQKDTLWSRIHASMPSWAKQGEHLGALPAIKRLWPNIFAKQLETQRFVVSTHTMALAPSLEKLANDPRNTELKDLISEGDQCPTLPRKLAHLRSSHVSRIPGALERLRENDNEESESSKLEPKLNEMGYKPDAYYALLMFDGDDMGRILAGDDQHTAISYVQSFHPKVRNSFERYARNDKALKEYGDLKRAVSPNRHLAISNALSNFALHVAPFVIEEEFRGKLLYAGGDDVLAMLPVVDLLPAMRRLREAYEGHSDRHRELDWREVKTKKRLTLKDGFAYLKGNLMRMMGGATASCGAVIAHHQAPLAMVLRELRSAEQRAKNQGGRDAFCLSILKRAGGALCVCEKWGGADELLERLRKFLAQPGVSRRAVYNSLLWLRDLPDSAGESMLSQLLLHQLKRQTDHKTTEDFADLLGIARGLAQLAVSNGNHRTQEWLANFMSTSEFLAREARAPDMSDEEQK